MNRRGRDVATLLMLVLLPSCAGQSSTSGVTPVDALSGTSGPVSWEVTNIVKQVAADGQEVAWRYTIVLKETAGRNIALETDELALGEDYNPYVQQNKVLRRIGANSELRISSSARTFIRTGHSSRLTGAEQLKVWRRFVGKDDRGQRVVVDVRFILP